MKSFIKNLFVSLIFLTLPMWCSQADKNVIDAEKQARVMILQSAQAMQEVDKLLERKQQEKTISEKILEWYEVVLDNNMNEYEKARDREIPIMSYDQIASRWNYSQFDDLIIQEQFSYRDIKNTEAKIVTLQERIHNLTPFGLSLIGYLQCELAGYKQNLQDFFHTMRSEQVAKFWLNICTYSKIFIEQQQQIFEKLSQEEDELRYYRDEYQRINSELKELWDDDEQAALIDRRAQLTIKLLQQDSINSFQQQHKILQSFVNEKILAIGMAKVAERKQTKKERKLMATEDVAMHKFLLSEKREQVLQAAEQLCLTEAQKIAEQRLLEIVQHDRVEIENLVQEITQRVSDRHDLWQAEQQSQAYQQVLQSAELVKKQAKRAKERNRKQRQKQAVRELSEQVDVQRIADETEEKLDTSLGFCKQDGNGAALVGNVGSLTYQKFLADMQGPKLYDPEDHASVIKELLKCYACLSCDDAMTDEKMEAFHQVIRRIIFFNQLLQKKNQRMAWYVSLDPKIYKKMCDRFVDLSEQEKNIKNLQSSLDEKCTQANQELAELRKLCTEAKDKKDTESMRVILNQIKQKMNQIDEFTLEYNTSYAIHKNMAVLDSMKIMHGTGGILNIEQLSSDIDFSTWENGTLSKAFMNEKIKELRNEIVIFLPAITIDSLPVKLQSTLNIWLKDYFGYVKLSLQDCQKLSDQFSQRIGDTAYAYNLGHIDIENLEYSLHKFFKKACASDSTQYTQNQINDIVQVYLTLMKYLASIMSE